MSLWRDATCRETIAQSSRDALQLLFVETDPQSAIHDRDGCRCGAAITHALLALSPDRESLAGGKAVRDDRRLERDDGSAVRQRPGDFCRAGDELRPHGIAPAWAIPIASRS